MLNIHEKGVILDALDVLALALATHGHKWTDDERALYEEAIFILEEEKYPVKENRKKKDIEEI